jgi:hypothetical protein
MSMKELSQIHVKVDGKEMTSGWLENTKTDNPAAIKEYVSKIKSAFGTSVLVDEAYLKEKLDRERSAFYAETKLKGLMEKHNASLSQFERKSLQDFPNNKFEGVTKIMKSGCCGSQMLKNTIEVSVQIE